MRPWIAICCLLSACWVGPAEVQAKLDAPLDTDTTTDTPGGTPTGTTTPTGTPGGTTTPTGTPTGTTTTSPLPCVDIALNSAVGPNVSSGTTDGAGDDFAGDCAGAVPGTGNDLVFHWVAPNDGCFAFDSSGSAFDSVIFVLDGTCDGDELGCNDDRSGIQNTSELGLEVLGGQDYLVVLDGYDAGDNGSYQLGIHPTAFLAADEDLGGATGTYSGDNIGADDTLNPAICPYASGSDHLLSWTAPSTATYTFSLDGVGTTFDSVLSLHRQCTNEAIVCDDVFGTVPYGGESVSAPLLAGETILIRVAGFQGYTGSWQLTIQ